MKTMTAEEYWKEKTDEATWNRYEFTAKHSLKLAREESLSKHNEEITELRLMNAGLQRQMDILEDDIKKHNEEKVRVFNEGIAGGRIKENFKINQKLLSLKEKYEKELDEAEKKMRADNVFVAMAQGDEIRVIQAKLSTIDEALQ